jgi:site-specific recombinase XerD
MLKKFINWMRNNRGFSENTISNYSRTLEQFDDFLKKNTMEEVTIDNPEGITHHLINSYIALESAKGKSTKTTNNKLA